MHIRNLPFPDPGEPDVRSGLRLMLWLGRTQIGTQITATCWGLAHLLGIAALPIGVGMAVQAVVDGSGTRLAWAGALILGLGVVIALADAMVHRVTVSNWITAAVRLQQLLARRAADLGSLLTRRVAAGEVVAVSSGDVEKIGWFVEATSRLAASAITMLTIAVGLLVYQPALGVVVAVGLPLMALSVIPLLPPATRRADVQRDKAGYATELAADTVAGLRVLRGIGGEGLFLRRYREASQQVRGAAVRTARMWSLIAAVQVFFPGLVMLTIVVYGANLALDGRITIGELVTVYSTVLISAHPLRNFEEFAMAYSFARPSAKRAARVLALRRPGEGDGTHRTGTPDASDTRDASDGGGAGDGTRTGPPTGDLQDPVSGLLVPHGTLTAVVCGDPDAAGELADRLGGHSDGGDPADTWGRFGAVPDGENAEPGRTPAGNPPARDTPRDSAPRPAPASVRLGGVELDALPLDHARTAILVQDKEPMLLSGTLRELLDVPASGRVSATEALTAAECGDVLTALARASADGDPMRAVITERGRSLSGGQRQRLALARSLVTDPEVLVLDEPTSAVDSHTEARIAAGLRRLRAERTTVVLTSSPLLLDLADRVVLMDGTTIAATGTHRSLLRDEPRYRAIVTRETDRELQSEGAREGTRERAADQADSTGSTDNTERSARHPETGRNPVKNEPVKNEPVKSERVEKELVEIDEGSL
ncbi:ABC transporter transmembrane domain-containing protein [Streptomyces sp. NPDC057638]|uniref:ABC transporter transmembrane domain-containing protein n=1 Tax=Streptomyces sp. NPDC057638 TaxID=3346190 RepID=UPI0036A88257